MYEERIKRGAALPREEIESYSRLTEEWQTYLTTTAPGTDDHA